ncbi:elongation factor P 5-aminopentanone reductase [Halalkalibacter nanhaiisediminis]|uniref:3-oxoacyl-[acyl-carrier protein] reductase n=1 Tax=Halalkalibacter nanhaiisediminis TaxID=688079 RepID=A0A562QEU6_9BACI|nr:SDR family oxidoreductase [Halalkalibacter nanhaiisediminis]TWI55223.1 3-oxoacyl-[acyl-carrier protein] reductase [Halalkalibacter nanhaiisediminis]
MRNILITGASGGIGSAIAQELASPGCSLFLHYYRNHSATIELAKVCEEKGAKVTMVSADLTSDDGDEKLLATIPNGIIFDVIIHNAGMSPFGLFTDMTNTELKEVMNIHLLNPMKMTRTLLPQMISRQSGKIVVVSSIWGLTGASCEVVYSAAKGGLNSFVKGLAKELAPSNIQVNGVAPGAIETDMLTRNGVEHLAELVEEIPANNLGKPQDIADAIAFLASQKANYINGQILSVNGAWYC